MLKGSPFTKPRRRTIWIWAAMAVTNLGIGILIALQPSRAADLESVWRWGGQWLFDGTNIYAVNDGSDYPPHAIVLLAPLAMLPFGLVVPLWALVNLVLACLAPAAAARFVRPGIPFSVLVLPTLMFLCWGGVRTLLQFTLLSLTFGLAALVTADRRPAWSGIFLGLALIKPQVALPMFLWAVFAKRLRMVSVAIITVIAGFLLFCVRAAANPLDVLRLHLSFLGGVLTGAERRVGLSELRPLIELAIAPGMADVAAAGVALVLLAFICGVGFQEAQRGRTAPMFAAPPLAALWTLLTFYHLTYGFTILLPAMMLLALGPLQTSRLRKRLFWTMQVGLMFDVPGLWRMSGLSAPPLLSGLAANVDRALFLLLFVGLVTLSRRERN